MPSSVTVYGFYFVSNCAILILLHKRDCCTRWRLAKNGMVGKSKYSRGAVEGFSNVPVALVS
jgi:hypothetical protein